jgi:hypothetical protein
MESRRAEIVKQKERDEASLNALPSVRPTAAINSEISALLDTRKDLDAEGRGKCVGWLPGKAAREVCVEVSRDRVELETAKKREDLDANIRQAAAELSALPASGTRANDDALGVVKILARFSIAVTTDDINDILALIMVFVIESAGGLMFNAATQVWEGDRGPPKRVQVVAAEETEAAKQLVSSDLRNSDTQTPNEPRNSLAQLPPSPQPPSDGLTTLTTSALTTRPDDPVTTLTTSKVTTPVTTVVAPKAKRVIRLKVVAGSQVVSQQNVALKSKVAEWALSLPVNQATWVSQRELAVQLGVSLRAVQKALKVLADRRVVRVVTTSSGTVVTRLK